MTTKITSANLATDVLQLKITSIVYTSTNVFASMYGGDIVTIQGQGFNTSTIIYVNFQPVVTTYFSSTQLTIVGPAISAGTYTVVAYNLDGASAIKPTSIYFSSFLPSSLEYLVVAGGGSGASGYEAAGGGAGGVLSSSTAVLPGTYTITVGGGGATQTNTNGITGNSGNNSSITATSITSIIAYGGGGGGGYQQIATNSRGTGNGYGRDGGSGGGASRGALGGVGVYPGSAYVNATRQGYNGGDTPGSGTVAGGGGAGAVGGNGVGGAVGGVGGVGTSTNIISTTRATVLSIGQVSGGSVYFGGGGGGGGDSGGGAGGLGGGGAGNSVAGTPFTGGGGGGQRNDNSVTGKAGGSGAVIVRYLDTFSPATSTTGGPTIAVEGGYRIYIWTSSGSITF